VDYGILALNCGKLFFPLFFNSSTNDVFTGIERKDPIDGRGGERFWNFKLYQ